MTGDVPLFDVSTAVDRGGRVSAAGAPSGFGGGGGGFSAAVALRAMSALIADPRHVPRSLAMRLLAPVRTEPELQAMARIDRAGRSVTATSVTLEQRAAPAVLGSAVFGPPGAATPPQRTDVAMPDVPGPSQTDRLTVDPITGQQMSAHVERRPVEGSLPFAASPTATLMAWFRVGEDRPVDEFATAFLADALLPPLYATLTGPVAMPSLEFSVHFGPGARRREVDDDGWLLGVFRHVTLADGFIVDDGELWRPDGELAAVLRQLRLVL